MQLKSTPASPSHPCVAADLRARCPQRGAGRLKALIWLGILAGMVFVGLKVVPVLLSEYQFQDAMQTTARMASVTRKSEAEIRQALAEEAQRDDLPVRPEDIQVHGQNGNMQIEADYSVTVDLVLYKWTLNFHPSVRNSSVL